MPLPLPRQREGLIAGATDPYTRRRVERAVPQCGRSSIGAARMKTFKVGVLVGSLAKG